MFYGQCWKCGERWELGTASTCKCPEELPAYTFKTTSEPMFGFFDTKPNHNITFHRDGKQIGVLDFNGPEMVFSGDMDESAKVFFDYVATAFKARLDQERANEREACAKVCEEEASRAKWNWDNDISGNQPFWNGGEQLASSCATAIRARRTHDES